MKKTLLLIALIIITTSISPALATLGPIHVELNMVKPRISSARANSVTAFKIYMRYNVDLKIHDWMKVWFPIDEAFDGDNNDDIINGICDGLVQNEDYLKNPRFIPADEYFEKHESKKEKYIKKIYANLDERGKTEFFELPSLKQFDDWEDICNLENGKQRIIKDPSGLGAWMLGTLMPSMPIDDEERKEKLIFISRTISISYSPQAECQGYPVIVSTCNERSLQFNTAFEWEAWRKGYNSMDFNTSKSTGIISPATPGRYKIAAATQSEPEPVESESFVLPCSDVSNVKLVDSSETDSQKAFSVKFDVGEGGALDGGSSLIKIRLPKDFTMPIKIPTKSIKVNNVFVNTKLEIVKEDNGNLLKIICPTDINNLTCAEVSFLHTSGINWKQSAKPVTVEVSTSSEPNFIKSEPFVASTTSGVAIFPNHEFEKMQASFKLVLGEKSYTPKTNIVVDFPQGFEIPKSISPASILVDGTPLKSLPKIEDNKISFESVNEISAFCRIFFNMNCGIRNPKVGNYSFTVQIGNDSYQCGSVNFIETPGYISDLNLSVSQGSSDSKYEFLFMPSSGKQLEAGDQMTIEFPEGTILPENPDASKILVSGNQASKAWVDGLKLGFIVSAPVRRVDIPRVSIDIGITNPVLDGEYVLNVSTSKGDAFVSEKYHIKPAPYNSRIYFKDPENPNCDPWFNKQPLVGFECTNPQASIYYWFDNNSDEKKLYNEEFRFPFKTFNSQIHWEVKKEMYTKSSQSASLMVDSEKPILEVFKPETETVYANVPTYEVVGERFLTDAPSITLKSKHMVLDPVYIKVNGVETKVLDREFFHFQDLSPKKTKFTHKVKLPYEGRHELDIVSVDEACNETVFHRTIILDTTIPKMFLLEPDPNKVFFIGDEVTIRIKTESGTRIYHDGQPLDIESDDGKYSIQTYKITINNKTVGLRFVAEDIAGNTSSLITQVIAVPKKTVVVMTLDSPKWTIDGIDYPPLKTPPTSKFADPKHKALNGTTFMPIAVLGGVLEFDLGWDANEKKTIITQHSQSKSTVIEVWIGKNIARINGKETKLNAKGTLYPVIINAKTMLPLRFVAENLGADIHWDAKTKKITITYPK